MANVSFSCTEPNCLKVFANQRNLKKHEKIHSRSGSENVQDEWLCHVCDASFKESRYRRTHLIKFHGLELKPTPTSVGCQDCNYTTLTLAKLREHLAEEHGLEILAEVHDFPTYADFEAWKKVAEKKNNSWYVAQRGKKKTLDGYKQTLFCNRTGHYKGEGKGLRTLKAQGSCKLNAYCTSSMDITVTSSNVKVKFCPTHYGHSLDFQDLIHIRIPKAQKDAVAGSVVQGVALSQILDNISEAATGDQASLAEMKDLNNISNSYALDNKDCLHNEDATSVSLWVKRMEDAILVYKPRGYTDIVSSIAKSEFVLVFMLKCQQDYLANEIGKSNGLKVCMDTTYGISGAYGFDLTTLLTISDLNECLPVAFCISSKVSEPIVTTFLAAVKSRVGNITANVFMSNDTPLFKNSWVSTMGHASHYLLCAWDVDRSFRKKLSKIDTTEKKAIVYKLLRRLMEEQEKEKFKEMLEGFLKFLVTNSFTEFHTYFTKNFVAKMHMWARCYREGLHVNTNIHLESLHKVLKYIHLSGKKVKRVDRVCFALVQLVQEKLFNERHKRGISLVSEVVQLEQGVFVVGSIERYVVMKVENCTQCYKSCQSCDICRHTYACDCADSIGNICKHAHAVALWCKEKAEIHALKHESNDAQDEVQLSGTNVYHGSSDRNAEMTSLREEGMKLFSEMERNLQACTSLETVKYVISQLKEINRIQASLANRGGYIPGNTHGWQNRGW